MGNAHAKYACTTCRREFALDDVWWCDECGRCRCEDCDWYESFCRVGSPIPSDPLWRRRAADARAAVGRLRSDGVGVSGGRTFEVGYCTSFSTARWGDDDPDFRVPAGFDPDVLHVGEAEEIAEDLLRESGAYWTDPTAWQVDAVVRAGLHRDRYFDPQTGRRRVAGAPAPFAVGMPMSL